MRDTARDLILDNLDTHPLWEWVREQMALLHPTATDTLTPVLVASLRLERTGAVVRGWDGRFYRLGELGDDEPTECDPAEVAIILAGLDWSESRIVWRTFLELHRYRHCDVYDGMRALKVEGLIDGRVAQQYRWVGPRPSRQARTHARKQIREVAVKAREAGVAVLVEAILVDAYLDWLDRPIAREYQCGSRFADLFDKSRKLLIEAKADADAIVVAHAVGQVSLYRHLAPKGVSQVAVLLPKRPSAEVRSFLRGTDVGLIWQDGDGGFVEQLV
jgi:hypothetical protein